LRFFGGGSPPVETDTGGSRVSGRRTEQSSVLPGARYPKTIKQTTPKTLDDIGPRIVSHQNLRCSPTHLIEHLTKSHAEPRLQDLLPNLPGTDLSRGSISIRLPVRRQTTSLPELRRDNSRTSRVRDGVPRLLTRLEDLWLLDLREPTDESGRGPQRDHRTRRVSPKQSVTPRVSKLNDL